MASSSSSQPTIIPTQLPGSSPPSWSPSPSSSSPCSLAGWILDQLHDEDGWKGKKTCRQCLRSKTFPCPQVQKVLEENSSQQKQELERNPQVLVEAQDLLLQKYTLNLPTNDQDNTDTLTSLTMMSRVATMTRFLQLLLVFPKKLPLQEQPPAPAVLSEDQVDQMVMSVLEACTKGLLCLAQHDSWKPKKPTRRRRQQGEGQSDDHRSSQDDDQSSLSSSSFDPLRVDISTAVDICPVVCFAYASWLRLSHAHVKLAGRPTVVIALWRALAQLASIHDENFSLLPPQLLQDGIQALSTLIQEGTTHLLQQVSQYCRNPGQPKKDDTVTVPEETLTQQEQQSLLFYSKLMTFLVGRLSILTRWFHVSTSTGNQNDRPDPDLWTALLRLRGISMAILAMIPKSSQHNQKILRASGGRNGSWLLPLWQQYQTLATKTEKYLIKCCILSSSINQQEESHPVLHRPSLDVLMDIRVPAPNKESVNENNNVVGCSQFSSFSLTLGRLCLLQKLLALAAAPEEQYKRTSMKTNGNDNYEKNTNDIFSRIREPQCWTEKDVESLLWICETFHSVALSECLEPLLLVAGEAFLLLKQKIKKSSQHVPDEMVIAGGCLLRTLISDSLASMNSVLKRIITSPLLEEGSHCSFPHPKASQLQRLFLRWMGPTVVSSPSSPPGPRQQQLNPLSREYILSLLYVVINGGIETDTAVEKYEVSMKRLDAFRVSFLPLLVKVLLDTRTTSGLRANISTLLVRILSSLPSSRSEQHEVEAIRQQIRSLVESEWTHLLQESAKQQKRIKKRKRTGKTQPTDKNKIHHNIKIYTPEDVQAISRLLTVVGGKQSCPATAMASPALSYLRREILSFCQNLGSSTQSRKRSQRPIIATDTVRSALFLSYIQGMTSGWSRMMTEDNQNSLSPSERFKHICGMELSDLACALLLTALPSSKNCTKDYFAKHPSKEGILLTSILNFCTEICESVGREAGNKSLPVEAIVCELVLKCSNSPFLLCQTKATTDKADRSVKFVRYQVVFRAIALMENIGKALPLSCPEKVLEHIKRTFNHLLSSNDWAVVSYAISSLIAFGSTLHPAHQPILQPCLPGHRMRLFQARIKGTVWNKKKNHEGGGSSSLVPLNLFKNLVPGRLEKTSLGSASIFPSVSSYNIPVGSFFMQMPTQENRRALVIFPPGEQSIKDIKHMYELQDETELPHIQSLKRVVALSSSTGCKFLLQAL